MEIRKTTGIVLSARNYGEADVLCTILTSDFGKGKFIFKGLRKSRKRSHTAAEPGSVSSLQYYYHDQKDSSIVNDFSVQKYFPGIRRDLAKIYHLYILLETTDSTTGLNDPENNFYGYLYAALERMETTDSPVHLTAAYLLHLLKFHGLLEISGSCDKCGKTDYNFFTLNQTDLKVACANCLKNGNMLPRTVMDFIRQALQNKFTSIKTETFDEPVLLDLIYQLLLFIEGYYHVHFKSKDFILNKKTFPPVQ